MNGSQGIQWQCSHRAPPFLEADARPARRLLLAPFSTSLPRELLDRVRVAAPRLGLHQGGIAAAALDIFLTQVGF